MAILCSNALAGTNEGAGLWQYSAKLLKKPDQYRAVVSCSHLFWVEGERGVRDGERYQITVTLTNDVYVHIHSRHCLQVNAFHGEEPKDSSPFEY